MLVSHRDAIGDWKLETAQFEMADDGTITDIYGPDPIGWLSLTAAHRFYAILMSSTRQVPKGDADLPQLFNTMMAYAGEWRVEGQDKLIVSVDTSWHPAWIGTEQIRFFRLREDGLQIRTSKSTHPQMGSRELYGVLSWSRHKG